MPALVRRVSRRWRTVRRRPLAAALLALGATLAAPPPAAAQEHPGGDPTRSLGTGRIAGQIASGVVLAPVGFVAGGLTTRWVARRLGAGEERASSIGTAGAWSSAVLATAAGPSLVGARGPGVGSYPAAVGGAAAGGLLSWAIVRLNKRSVNQTESRPCHLVCIVSTVAIATLPSIGATIAYDASRRSAR
ncbi:MAG: hypothetical protein ACJ79S_03150 [Gemmatimonadaceae bacterium]